MTEVRRIALVGCGKAKRDHPAPARELYTSNLFRLSAEYAERDFDGWYVVSALHGLTDPDQVIAPYDWALKDLRVSEREAWCSQVAWHLASRERDAAARAAGLQLYITLLAGGLYRELAAYMRWTMIDAYIGPLRGAYTAVEEPLEGLGLGQRLAWLKQTLTTPSAA